MSGLCEPSLDVDCSVLDDSCVVGVCDPLNGYCAPENKEDGTNCGTENLCKIGGFTDVCKMGNCVPTEDVDCSSLDTDCTYGVCSLKTGSCFVELTNQDGVCTPDIPCE